ncbi:MAG: hypothetical protein QF893_23290 [Alphaproteobacteria bacterium]|jgi:hypothetical protein|nr:hypothetical protein [Alphaproteobacteria bacterium]
MAHRYLVRTFVRDPETGALVPGPTYSDDDPGEISADYEDMKAKLRPGEIIEVWDGLLRQTLVRHEAPDE